MEEAFYILIGTILGAGLVLAALLVWATYPYEEDCIEKRIKRLEATVYRNRNESKTTN